MVWRCWMTRLQRCSSVLLLALALAPAPAVGVRHACASTLDGMRDAAARLVEGGEYPKAARLLEALRAADPNEPWIYVGLASARAGMRQYRAAAGAVRVGIAKTEERGDSESLAALLEHQRLAVESLLGHARTVLSRIGPMETSRLVERMDSVLVLPSRTEVLFPDTTRFFPDGLENLDVDDALECFRLATQMNPGAAKPFALVAFAYMGDERWTDAQRVLNAGLMRVPGDRDLERLWGQANRKIGGGYAY